MDTDKKKTALDSFNALQPAAKPRKRRSKWLAPLLLLGVLGLCAYLVFFTDLISSIAPEPTALPNTKVKLIDRLKSEFLSVTIQRKGDIPYTIKSNMEFDDTHSYIGNANTGHDFVVSGKEYFLLNQVMCSVIANNATALSAADVVQENATDFSVYGLLTPSLLVDIQYKDSTTTRLGFGDKAPVGGNYYLQVNDGDTVYTIPANQYDAFDKELNQMHLIPNPAAHIEPDNLVSLMIEQTGMPNIELRRSELSDQEWEAYKGAGFTPFKLTSPIQREGDTMRADDFAHGACALALAAYVDHAPTQQALAAYGLDFPRAHIVLHYEVSESPIEDDQVGMQSIGEQIFQLWIGAQMDEFYTYAMPDQSGDVYKIESTLLKFLDDARVENLIDQFVALENVENVKRVEISSAQGETQTLIIRRETDTTYAMDGEAMEEQAFADRYEKIISLQFDRFIEQKLDGFPHASVRFIYEDDRPDLLIEYLTYDRDFDQIRIGDENLFLIKKDKIDGLLDFK